MKDAIHHRKHVQKKMIQSLYRDSSNKPGYFFSKNQDKKKLLEEAPNYGDASLNSYHHFRY